MQLKARIKCALRKVYSEECVYTSTDRFGIILSRYEWRVERALKDEAVYV